MSQSQVEALYSAAQFVLRWGKAPEKAMEALKELGRFVAFLIIESVGLLFWAACIAIAFMAVAVYSLIVFSLGLKIDSKGELSYRS